MSTQGKTVHQTEVPQSSPPLFANYLLDSLHLSLLVSKFLRMRRPLIDPDTRYTFSPLGFLNGWIANRPYFFRRLDFPEFELPIFYGPIRIGKFNVNRWLYWGYIGIGSLRSGLRPNLRLPFSASLRQTPSGTSSSLFSFWHKKASHPSRDWRLF